MKSTFGIPTRRHMNVRKRVFNGKRINNTRRVERVLNLIKYLSEFKTIREISSHLIIHEKSVQRYLNLLVQLGFDVEVSMGKYHSYRITNIKEYFNLK